MEKLCSTLPVLGVMALCLGCPAGDDPVTDGGVDAPFVATQRYPGPCSSTLYNASSGELGTVRGVTHFSYDDAGNQVEQVWDNRADGEIEFAHTHHYDEAGRRIRTEAQDGSSGFVYRYTFNDIGLVEVEEHAPDETADASWRATFTYTDNNPTGEEQDLLGDGTLVVQITRVFDGDLEIEEYHDTDLDETADKVFRSTYDQFGNRLRETSDLNLDGVVSTILVDGYDCWAE